MASKTSTLKSEPVPIVQILAFNPQTEECIALDVPDDKDCRDTFPGYEIKYRVRYIDENGHFELRDVRRNEFVFFCEVADEEEHASDDEQDSSDGSAQLAQSKLRSGKRRHSLLWGHTDVSAPHTEGVRHCSFRPGAKRPRSQSVTAFSILTSRAQESDSRSPSPVVGTPTDPFGGVLLDGRGDGVSPTNGTSELGQSMLTTGQSIFGFPSLRDTSKGPLQHGRAGYLPPLPRQQPSSPEFGFDGEQSQLVKALKHTNIAEQ